MKPTLTLLTTAAALALFSVLSAAETTNPHAPAKPASGEFARRLLPAPRGGGFRMDDYWTWDGSVIRGPDGRYHMFASRWSKQVSFSPNWVACSEVVRAVSATPEGPYQYVETVIKRRGPQYY